MIYNNSITIYHKENDLDTLTHLEKWKRYNYDKVWFFKKIKARINEGYTNANNVQVRIPYDENKNLNINDFAVGDIIVEGKIDLNIETQEDLSNYEIFNITGITNNNFGQEKHIHLEGE